MFYVIEFQSGETGSVIPFAFTNEQYHAGEADAKYHDLLRVAATSNVRKHGVILMTDYLVPIKQDVYTHGGDDDENTIIYVLEVQSGETGAIIPFAFTSDQRSTIDSKYYTILAAAAQSSVPRHGAMVIDEDLNCNVTTDRKVFIHS